MEDLRSIAISLLVSLAFLVQSSLHVHALSCSQSSKIKGRNSQTGKFMGKRSPPPGKCNQENDTDHCCVQGKFYATQTCSPLQVTDNAKATLTLSSFQKKGDGNCPSKCDHYYHDDDTPVVALSTGWYNGWYNGGSRCLKKITINANGRSVEAMVVDECDSTVGCDNEHDYNPPSRNNTVDASKAVWKALGVPKDKWGTDLDITWSDA